ncbi:MAG TPA: ribosome small subunit-dependent GTPase A [Burkholderiaceae bacterium]|nr:ribosome small subunit-dependent GTPase A [Burkholderiaceae bacterium]HMX09947.1 ribosome small subunit-dependent GTPase A [Burkholderiaceae bacterium]HMY99044.1 ribosome small subunit-dependent GTPase A [Burkholderiaceae bacterium]HNB43239.1 ribosome small subunit-dependent GTPase A [Burkholderiaceae bacterium]HNG78756.1 ribosome small subunit-dependent GTPase A [Burkholderiaceae bacterium]
MARESYDIGLVIAGHGRHYVVETPEGREVLCHPRGKKSDAVVGDRVRWLPTNQHGDEGVIEALEPRRNLLYRQDEWRTKSFAANLDRLLVLVAAEPVFSESQLTRALIAAEEAGIEVLILLNKVDLVDAARLARERLASYRAMGYEVLEVALKSRAAAQEVARTHIDDAHRLLAERLGRGATLVLGPSGTGKSTLVNLLVPEAAAQTGEISSALNSGRHTTTHTRWYWLDEARQGALIDSPGFQEFGMHHIELTELARWMPDLRAHLGQCRFHNCTHIHEPGCAVRSALERGEISPSRYRIYQELRQELGRPKW